MKDKLLFLFKFSLSVGILFMVADSVDINRAIDIIKKIDVYLFSISFLVLVLQTLFATIRWQIVLRYFEFHSTFLNILRYLWIGIFFNQALPSSIGGDAVRAYYLCRNGISIKKASLGVLLDRISGIMGLTVLVLFTTPYIFQIFSNSSERVWLVFLILLTLLAFTFTFTFDLILKGQKHWRILRALQELSLEGRRVIFSKHYGFKLIVLSSTVHLMSIIAVIVLANGLGMMVDWYAILIVVPLATLLITIPVSIAGWGIREGVMVVGLGYFGVSSEQSLALSILYGLLMLVVSIPGGVLWAINNKLIKKNKK